MPTGVENMIMHISLPIGNGNILMGTDAPEEMGFSLNKGNNFYLCLGPESKEEADRIFNQLSDGGQVEMALQDTFWGAYYGSLTDKFGVKWMVNYQKQ